MEPRANGILLLLSLLFGLAAAELYISHQSLAKQESESFSVTCKDKSNGAGLSWKGPKNRPLGAKTNPQAKATMYGIHLIFRKIRKEDAGVYTCKTSTDSANFELFVTTPITFVDTPSNVTAREGTNILLRCEAKGANTEWLINGEAPKDDAKYKALADALLIKNATVEDSRNNYSCNAINTDIGELTNKLVTVVVTHPPRPKYMKENIVYGYIGGVVNLTCEVDAEPSPTFRWYQKGEKNKIFGKEIQGTSPTVSVLMVALRDPKDLGDYKCEAKNSEGIVDVIFTVLNGSQPNSPSFLEIHDANSSAIFLTIEEPEPNEFENSTGLAPTGFLVQYRPIDEPQWSTQSFLLAEDKTYALTNLTKNTTYQVRAATINPVGFSDFTNTTEYSTSSAYKTSANLPYLYTIFSVILIFASDLFHLHI